jgi:hypothetical protein
MNQFRQAFSTAHQIEFYYRIVQGEIGKKVISIMKSNGKLWKDTPYPDIIFLRNEEVKRAGNYGRSGFKGAGLVG